MNNWDIYAKGKMFMSRNPLVARQFFEDSYNFEPTRYKSLLKLLSLDLKEGNFKDARRLINLHKDDYQNALRFNVFRGYLEHDELNFLREEKILCANIRETNLEASVNNLADIDLQFERFDRAFYRYYSLIDSNEYSVKSVFKIAALRIIEGNYEGADDALGLLDVDELSNVELRMYRDFKKYLRYFKGKLRVRNVSNPKKKYKLYRLVENGNDTLLRHLEKHKHQRPYHHDGCFIKEINFYELIGEATEIIKTTKPVHGLTGDKYIVDTRRRIGMLDKEEMTGLCIVTILGTKIIVTMYPVLLSEEFNIESYNNHILKPKNRY